MIIPGFKGLNNRLSDTGFPHPTPQDPFALLRNAVNVDVDNSGNVNFPRPGSVKRYSGTDVHSWYEFEDSLGYGLFVDNGQLMRLNFDYTGTALATVKNEPMGYCTLDGKVHYSNGIDSGIYDNLTVRPWGIDNPPRQPDAAANVSGGMFAGEYKVAITWLNGEGDHFQESGTYAAKSVTVAEGGGIRLTNFPTPPTEVDKVAVYVSAVNSAGLYLYDEYPATVDEVYLGYNVGTVNLDFQFAVKPQPKLGLTVHNGGIFWKDGSRVHYTEPHAVSLYRAANFFDLEDEVLALVSIKTGPLYVQTTKGLWAISGVYNPEGPAAPKKLRNYGGVRLLQVAYHPNKENEAFLWTDAGFVRISDEGVEDLNIDDVAPPHFEKGALTYVEQNGIRKLVFVGQSGTVNRLQHPDYSAAETTRLGRAF